MKLDKYDRIFIAFMFVIVTIFSIGQCFAVEDWETVNITTVEGILADSAHNYFYSTTTPNTGVTYFSLEAGYIYRVRVVQDMISSRIIVGTSEIPALNGQYTYLTSDLQNVGDSYSIIGGSNYAFIAYSPSVGSSHIVVERQKIEGMNSTIGDLVDNVGFNQLWGVFENGVDFIGVVVLVAFGLFLVFLLIKKVSKGKSDF